MNPANPAVAYEQAIAQIESTVAELEGLASNQVTLPMELPQVHFTVNVARRAAAS
ncbi:MAG: hypothetical protein U1G07_14150 [Verrucomicrobiota bacterium]